MGPAAIPMILQGASLGAQLFASHKGGKANKSNQTLLNEAIDDNESFYNRNVKGDYLDTNAAKGMFERMRKNLKRANDRVENKAVVTGATAEAEIAEKSKNQENYNDAVSQLAEKATEHQLRSEGIARGEKGSLINAQMNINSNKANNAANLANNAANLAQGASAIAGAGKTTSALNEFGRTAEQEGALKDIANTAG